MAKPGVIEVIAQGICHDTGSPSNKPQQHTWPVLKACMHGLHRLKHTEEDEYKGCCWAVRDSLQPPQASLEGTSIPGSGA